MSTYRERMQPYIDRLVWDFKNLANDSINPYVAKGEGDLEPKNRTALEDIHHALKNLVVEGWRRRKENPPAGEQ